MLVNKLLIDEQPLQVLRSLAVAIGLNEAIILQQLHYEMRLERHVFEGVSWVYYTYEQWRERDFPFWSVDTLKRAIYHLEKDGLIASTMRFNHSPIDKRKWYTIAYEKLEELGTGQVVTAPTMQNAMTTGQNATTTMQNAPIDVADCPDDHSKMPRLPKIPTKKTTQEETLPPVVPQGGQTYSAGFEHFWSGYPEKKGKDQAWKVWRRLKLEPLTDRICDSVREHLAHDRAWKNGFYKYPATYLAGGCWNDEFAAPPPQPSPPLSRSTVRTQTNVDNANIALTLMGYRDDASGDETVSHLLTPGRRGPQR
jgi:hypothetical protein